MQLVDQATLIAKCRVEADMEGSEFISDAQIGDWLNDEQRTLQNLLLKHRGQGFYARRTSPPLNVVSGAPEVRLPADFYQLLSARIRPVGETTGAQDRLLEQCDVSQFVSLGGGGSGPPTHYCHRSMFATDEDTVPSEIIELFPTPNLNALLVVDYVPAFRIVTSGAVQYNGINGFEMFMVYRVAARMLHKEQSDPSFLLGMASRVEDDIKSLAPRRDRQMATMINVYSEDSSWWWGRLWQATRPSSFVEPQATKSRVT